MRISRLTLLGILVGAAVPTVAAQGVDHFTINGNTVAIFNLAGRAEIVTGSGNAVAVTVTRGGADAKTLRVEQGSRDGVNDLRAVYPDHDLVYPPLGRWERTTVHYDRDGYFEGDHDRGGSRIRIAGSGSGTEAWADLRIEVPAGKSLALHLAVGDAVATNVKGRLKIDVASSKVRAHGIEGALTIDGGAGHVIVEDMSGETSIDVGSGGVELNNVTGSSLKVDAGSGGIRGSLLTLTSLSVDVGSGGVTLDRVTAEKAGVDAGSGSVRLEFLNSPKSLTVDTGSGGATITFPASLSATIDIETGSGGISNDFPVQLTRVERRALHGRIGAGDGHITIETGSGGVELRRK